MTSHSTTKETTRSSIGKHLLKEPILCPGWILCVSYSVWHERQEVYFQVAVTFAYTCFCRTISEHGVSALLNSFSLSLSLFCWTLSQDTTPPAFAEQMFPKMLGGRVWWLQKFPILLLGQDLQELTPGFGDPLTFSTPWWYFRRSRCSCCYGTAPMCQGKAQITVHESGRGDR